MRRSHRKKRAVSTIVAVMIILAIVVVSGLMLYMLVSGFFKTSGKAILSVLGTGTGSDDGQKATLNIILQNNGDGAARVVGIYIVPEGVQATVTSITIPGAPTRMSTDTTFPSTVPASMTSPGPGIDVSAKSSRTLYIQLGGTGLYPGAKIRVYIMYCDLASGQVSVTDRVITLK